MPRSRRLGLKAGGIALIVISGLLLIVFTFVRSFGDDAALLVILVVSGVLGFLAGTLGVRFYNLARQFEATTIEWDGKSADPRPPVLYLRSFQDDVTTAVPVSLPPRSLHNLAWSIAWTTEEEQLVKVLRAIGPVVAVGKPGEKLPELGASRAYVSNEDWRHYVTCLMKEAVLVVLRPGQTPSVWWEISEAVKRVYPERLLFALPFDRVQYDAFRQELHGRCGVLLPLLPPVRRSKLYLERLPFGTISAFVYFEPGGEPTLVPVTPNIVPFIRRTVRERLVPYYSYALRSLLVRCGADWRQPRISKFAVAFAVFLAIVVLGLINLAMFFLFGQS